MRRLAISVSFAIVALVATAGAEVVQEGNLRVSFRGSIAPHDLPRARPAPVAVRLGSTIGTVDGSRPPRLDEVSVAVNRTGHVSLAGLPTCSIGELEQTSTAAALNACSDALVGYGNFDAEVQFTTGPLIPVRGRVLVFDSRIGGKPALLLHIYNSSPVKLTFVVPFKIARRRSGDFGTVFSARIPHIASDRGYVTAIQLTLRRKYVFRGRRRSVFSASCAAAPGFPGAVFTLAKATFSFENGKSLTTASGGDCSVR